MFLVNIFQNCKTIMISSSLHLGPIDLLEFLCQCTLILEIDRQYCHYMLLHFFFFLNQQDLKLCSEYCRYSTSLWIFYVGYLDRVGKSCSEVLLHYFLFISNLIFYCQSESQDSVLHICLLKICFTLAGSDHKNSPNIDPPKGLFGQSLFI